MATATRTSQRRTGSSRVPSQRATGRRELDPTAPAYSCYLPHCQAPTEYRVTVCDMRWYRCSRCGIECPEAAFHQRPVPRSA